MSTPKNFKPTAYSLTQDECDSLSESYEVRRREAVAARDIASALVWCDALRMMEQARENSFRIRSSARRERLEKRLAPA